MRIAFLTLNAYDMLSGDGETVGGAQLQQVLIGRELADRGHDVVFIENESDHKREGHVDGIRVVTRPNRTDSNPLLQAVLRSLDLVTLLGRIDPDVCYVRMPLFELLPTAAYCMLSNTRLIYGFAHDSELGDSPIAFETRVTNNPLYRAAIRTARSTADTLIAQNEYQERLAREQYDCPVVKVSNGYQPKDEPGEPPFSGDRPVVLWVSTLRPWKRPELVLELADNVPEALFVIVGPRSDDAPEMYDEVRDGAQQRDNVRFEGFVPYDDIDAYFAASDIFCNTSTDEGFPNTFLQAWAYGTPVASLSVNPDGILAEGNTGVYADGDVELLASELTRILDDGERLSALSAGAREHFAAEHSIERLADDYERVFRGLSTTPEREDGNQKPEHVQ